ncbi:hypothetical protein QA645_38425 [Bradyrhizobium sp. CIAT3101]|uniref:hypothetical protein n=1 Tax=Bradyrhizobium sp. CIAT3101 TaxID=439387 RepID=UPI0024B1C7F4|nr:hypothetical protein [Bradyrhizobium sp. CIAT3101]WFU80314.1 hypothetical protein QA645_38425 [Bradyrhizobium sp. CIAT3101]
MDFLAFYLETGFNVGDLEKEGVSLALTGTSAPIDPYYNSRDAGGVLKSQRQNLAPIFPRSSSRSKAARFPVGRR